MKRRTFLSRGLAAAAGGVLAAAGGIWMLARARFFRSLGQPRRAVARSHASRHHGPRDIRPVTREELYAEHDLAG